MPETCISSIAAEPKFYSVETITQMKILESEAVRALQPSIPLFKHIWTALQIFWRGLTLV